MSIFTESVAYRPFSYSWAVEAERKHRIDMVWNENQVELQDDLRQFTSENGLETKDVSHNQNKNVLEKLIMLFTEMDSSVATGYTKILPYVGNNEIRTMFITFAAREVAHQRGYALAAETFGFTNSDWSEFKNYKEMQDKIDLLSQDIGDLSKPLNFAKMLSVILLGEGISLFGAFACLLNMRRFGLVQNFNTVNEWSLKDEQEHIKNNIRVLYDIREKDLSEVENIQLEEFIKGTVFKFKEAEHNFLDIVYEMGPQQDMTLEESKDFIDYLCELRLFQLGFIEADAVRKNPLPWIDYIISGSTHTNFFEARVVDYSHNALEGEADYSKFTKYLQGATI